MRNWNPESELEWVEMKESIQPTYEELKPYSIKLQAFYYACIQPTYEELKPD